MPDDRQPALQLDEKRPGIKKALVSQGPKSGAGDRDRTGDLMLGKHTL
jgi:hypothetical protein